MSRVIDAIATGAQGPDAPAFRVRLSLPAEALRANGVNLRLLPLFTPAEAEIVRSGALAARGRTLLGARRRLGPELRRIQDADVVVIQRQVDLFPSRTLERQAIAGRALILDVDDAMWLPQPGGHPLGRLRRNGAKLRWLAGRADHVIAGNEYLAEWLSRYARRVSVVPSLVDVEKVTPRVHRAAGTLTLGWIGSHSTVRYLDALGPVLAGFARAHPDLPVTLIVVGGRVAAIPGVRIEHWPWNVEAETAALAAMDVGLMPLPDNAWTRGKCAYKALQYMAAAVPVLADDVGVTASVVGEDAGILARGPGSWQSALERLATDVTLRELMGAQGRARVTADFSVSAWAPQLARVIAGTC